MFDYKVYPKFARLIGVVDRVEPKLRQTLWLMRLIEDLYEARYAKDIEALRRSSEPGEGEGGEGDDLSTPFPDFVYAFFEKKFGLPALVQQQCWDMLRTVHELRKENTAVETFARFMDEYYDADDLLFFLYARSTLQKELGKDKMAEHPMHHHWTFRTHWGELSASSTPLNVTERQCSNVSRVIFGSEADQNYRAFMHLLEGGHLRGGGVKEGGQGRGGRARRQGAAGERARGCGGWRGREARGGEGGTQWPGTHSPMNCAGAGVSCARAREQSVAKMTLESIVSRGVEGE